MRVLLIVLALAAVARGEVEVTVSTGKARDRAVARFSVKAAPGSYVLTGGGKRVPVTVGPDGQAACIFEHLDAGSLTMKLERATAGEGPGVEAKRNVETEQVTFSSGAKPILEYDGKLTPLPEGFKPEFQRGGYISPVWTPSGTIISDDYPPKHKHHHGIWSPWTKTQFEGRHPDFWNMGDKTGTVEFVALDGAWTGEAAAGLRTRHRMVDLSAKPEPKVALNETWDLTVFPPQKADRPYYLFDLWIEQRCAGDSPLLLPKYHYGGLGFRGSREWDTPGNPCLFITSEGKTRTNGNETRANWCWIGGKVQGQMAGITILCDPANFRAPQGVRLNPTEPFFCFAPSQQGDWAIKPGETYKARYRFVVADGELDKALIERIWADYADPVKVEVK